MADEIDLRFLAEQSRRILAELAEARTERAEIRAELADVRAEQHALASLLGKVSDAVTAVARTQERHSELLEKLAEIQANQGGRLNIIEGRLAIIEKHVGLVKA
jgi:hypothetical protein